MEKPGRPLGVSLAIIASTVLFAILPLLQVAMVLLVRRHFMNLSFEEGFEPVITGGDYLGVPESSLILQAVLGITFLVITVLAWRGRPPIMRLLLIAAVAIFTLIKFISIVAQYMAIQDPQTASSFDAISRSLGTSQVVLELLVTLYVIWYMNRAPARAFYRGYYLPERAEVTVQET